MPRTESPYDALLPGLDSPEFSRQKLDPYERMLRGKLIRLAAAHFTPKDVEPSVDTPALFAAAERLGRVRREEKPRVLLVLKNRFQAAALAVMMQRFGAKVFICTNGKDAYLKYLRRHSASFNLAIVQWDLDDVGGRDLVFYERQGGGNLGFVAALPPDMLAADAVRGGADLFLRMPLCVHMHTIRELLIPNAHLSYLYPTQLMARQSNFDGLRQVLDQVAVSRDIDAENIIAEAMMDFDTETQLDLGRSSKLLEELIEYIKRNNARGGGIGTKSEEYRQLGKAFQAAMQTFNKMKDEMVEMTNEVRLLRDIKRKYDSIMNRHLDGSSLLGLGGGGSSGVGTGGSGLLDSKRQLEFRPFDHIDVDTVSRKELGGYIKKFRRELHNAQVENDCLVRELERLSFFKVQVEEDLASHNISVIFQEPNVVVDAQRSQEKYRYHLDVTKHALRNVAQSFEDAAEPGEARVEAEVADRQQAHSRREERAKSLAAKSIQALKQQVNMARLREREIMATRGSKPSKGRTLQDLIRAFEKAMMENEDLFLQQQQHRRHKLEVKVVTPLPLAQLTTVDGTDGVARFHNDTVELLRAVCSEVNTHFAKIMASHPVLHQRMEEFSQQLRRVISAPHLRSCFVVAQSQVSGAMEQLRADHERDMRSMREVARSTGRDGTGDGAGSPHVAKGAVMLKMELAQTQLRAARVLSAQLDALQRHRSFTKWSLWASRRALQVNQEELHRKVRKEVFESKHNVVDRLHKKVAHFEQRVAAVESELESKNRLLQLQEQSNTKTERMLQQLRDVYHGKQRETEELQHQIAELNQKLLSQSRRSTLKRGNTPRESTLSRLNSIADNGRLDESIAASTPGREASLLVDVNQAGGGTDSLSEFAFSVSPTEGVQAAHSTHRASRKSSEARRKSVTRSSSLRASDHALRGNRDGASRGGINETRRRRQSQHELENVGRTASTASAGSNMTERADEKTAESAQSACTTPGSSRRSSANRSRSQTPVRSEAVRPKGQTVSKPLVCTTLRDPAPQQVQCSERKTGGPPPQLPSPVDVNARQVEGEAENFRRSASAMNSASAASSSPLSEKEGECQRSASSVSAAAGGGGGVVPPAAAMPVGGDDSAGNVETVEDNRGAGKGERGTSQIHLAFSRQHQSQRKDADRNTPRRTRSLRHPRSTSSVASRKPQRRRASVEAESSKSAATSPGTRIAGRAPSPVISACDVVPSAREGDDQDSCASDGGLPPMEVGSPPFGQVVELISTRSPVSPPLSLGDAEGDSQALLLHSSLKGSNVSGKGRKDSTTKKVRISVVENMAEVECIVTPRGGRDGALTPRLSPSSVSPTTHHVDASCGSDSPGSWDSGAAAAGSCVVTTGCDAMTPELPWSIDDASPHLEGGPSHPHRTAAPVTLMVETATSPLPIEEIPALRPVNGQPDRRGVATQTNEHPATLLLAMKSTPDVDLRAQLSMDTEVGGMGAATMVPVAVPLPPATTATQAKSTMTDSALEREGGAARGVSNRAPPPVDAAPQLGDLSPRLRSAPPVIRAVAPTCAAFASTIQAEHISPGLPQEDSAGPTLDDSHHNIQAPIPDPPSTPPMQLFRRPSTRFPLQPPPPARELQVEEEYAHHRPIASPLEKPSVAGREPTPSLASSPTNVTRADPEPVLERLGSALDSKPATIALPKERPAAHVPDRKQKPPPPTEQMKIRQLRISLPSPASRQLPPPRGEVMAVAEPLATATATATVTSTSPRPSPRGPHSTMTAANHIVARKVEATYSAPGEDEASPTVAPTVRERSTQRPLHCSATDDTGGGRSPGPQLAILGTSPTTLVASDAPASNWASQHFRLQEGLQPEEVAANEAAACEALRRRPAQGQGKSPTAVTPRKDGTGALRGSLTIASALTLSPRKPLHTPLTSHVFPPSAPQQQQLASSPAALGRRTADEQRENEPQRFGSISEAARTLSGLQRAARRLREACGLHLAFTFADNNPTMADVVHEVQRALQSAVAVAEEQLGCAHARRKVEDRLLSALDTESQRFKLDARVAAPADGAPLTEAARSGHESAPRRLMSRVMLGEAEAIPAVVNSGALALRRDHAQIIASQLQHPQSVKLLLLKQQQAALREQQRRLDATARGSDYKRHSSPGRDVPALRISQTATAAASITGTLNAPHPRPPQTHRPTGAAERYVAATATPGHTDGISAALTGTKMSMLSKTPR